MNKTEDFATSAAVNTVAGVLSSFIFFISVSLIRFAYDLYIKEAGKHKQAAESINSISRNLLAIAELVGGRNRSGSTSGLVNNIVKDLNAIKRDSAV
jgi:hypothetical protein